MHNNYRIYPYSYYPNQSMYNSNNMYPCQYWFNMPMYKTGLSDTDGRIMKFITTLNNRGFIVQEGKLNNVDILKLASEGKVPTCFGNNANAPYAVLTLPPAPNQDPAEGQEASMLYDPKNPNNYPANVNAIIPGATFKLRPDEAIVLIGQTPPPAYYFSFRSYRVLVENKPEKDYSDYITIGNDNTGFYHMIFASLGDTLSNAEIWTDNTPQGSVGYPFDSSTIIISSADKSVNQQIRDALGDAGYSWKIMNDDNIPMDLVNMGLEKGKDNFSFVMRAQLWAQQEIGDAYIKNIDKYFKAYRITPKIPFTNQNLWPIPYRKVRETYATEFQIVPTALVSVKSTSTFTAKI